MHNTHYRLSLGFFVVALCVQSGVIAYDRWNQMSFGHIAITAQTFTASSFGVCGNGVLETGEECDRGRQNGAGNCSLSCRLLVCGDGILSQSLGEECEPAKVLRTVINPATQKPESKLVFADKPACGSMPFCSPPTILADGSRVGGCEWAFLQQCSSSTAAIQTHSSSSVSSATTLPPSSVLPALHPLCGDGKWEDGEACDQGSGNSNLLPNSCRTDCTLPRCGDGVVDSFLGETCDGGLLCDSDCHLRMSSASSNSAKTSQEFASSSMESVTTQLPVCGDGVHQAGEHCDDGPLNSDTRPNACRTDCSLPHCGDHVVDAGEVCDGTPDCSSDCRLVATLSSSISEPHCGDGIIQKNEQCDDGNTVAGDGCAPDCHVEVFHAASAPSDSTNTALPIFLFFSLAGFSGGVFAGWRWMRGASL